MRNGRLLDVSNLHTYFFTYEGVVKAVRGVSLYVEPEELLGIVGETGSGKTVVLESIMRLIPFPGRLVEGDITFLGRDLLRVGDREMREIRGRDIGLIVPNPRSELNPLANVGEQIANAYRSHHPKATDKEAAGRALAMLEAVQMPDPRRRMTAYPHELSGGMAQRIVIAMALVNSPKLILADEPTSGLDVTIQIQTLDLIKDLFRQSGSAGIMVTRDLGVAAHYCHRVAVVYAGQIVETADVRAFFKHAKHPYSRALLSAAFAARGEKRRVTMTGMAPNLLRLPSGCALHPRCYRAKAVCSEAEPALEPIGPGHEVRCHFWDKED